MWQELAARLAQWEAYDTQVVATAALCAMACALPGNYLVLRRQSMMGDALSHTALPGIVLAFLLQHLLRQTGWSWLAADPGHGRVVPHAALFVGALALGLLAAVLTEAVQRWGQVDAGAALGVVFTSLFALGLLLMRAFSDHWDLDPDCVLYGTIETAVLHVDPATGLPRALLTNGLMFLANLALTLLFYKELRISAFDPAQATVQGIPSRLFHYGLMAVTAATLVVAFESVGSILVIAMLIAPPAAAFLLTDRLGAMLAWSLLLAALSALLGHALAIAVPPVLFSRLGFPTVDDASTSGMIALASGLVFVVCAVIAPRYGVLSRLVSQARLKLRIVGEDLLGYLIRREEAQGAPVSATAVELQSAWKFPALWRGLALAQLCRRRQIARTAAGYHLTAAGRDTAERLVRAHRLWESYMVRHFALADDHLHDMAARVEHFIDPQLQEELASELDRPQLDPHGRAIPEAAAGTTAAQSETSAAAAPQPAPSQSPPPSPSASAPQPPES